MGWFDDEYEDDYRDASDFGYGPNDEELYPCTDVWRSLHPFGYNPFTGGWTEEDDHNNGW